MRRQRTRGANRSDRCASGASGPDRLTDSLTCRRSDLQPCDRRLAITTILHERDFDEIEILLKELSKYHRRNQSLSGNDFVTFVAVRVGAELTQRLIILPFRTATGSNQ
jgi:hypothetical protein